MTTKTVQRFINSEGMTLVGDVGGPDDAPTVILMHGGGQTRHAWSGTMDRLVEQGYRVINMDARGHGDSDWSPTGSYRPDVQADDLATVLEHASHPVALVGASMGGFTSFYAVGRAEQPIAEALILVDIVLKPAEAGRDRIFNFMKANPDGFASLDEAADAIALYYPERPRPKNPSGLKKNLRLRDNGRYYWHWDPQLLDIRPTAEPPAFLDLIESVAPNVKLPTLLVRGMESDIVDDAGVNDMKRLVPQTEIFEIAGAGHMVAGDKNDAFSGAVIDFLARHMPVRSQA